MNNNSDNQHHAASASLSLPLCFGWGIGSLSVSLMFNATSLLLLRYLVDIVGVAAGLAGVLIGAAKIYDAITDPVMGTISDRTFSRWGRRRPFLLIGAVVSAISIIFLFNLAAFEHSDARIVIVVFALLLMTTGYTIFSVPYMAMPVEMTNDYHERTKLMSFRVGAVAAGQLLASFFGPMLIVAFGGAAAGHSAMSIVLAAFIAGAGGLCFWMTRNAPTTNHSSEKKASLPEQFTAAIQNRPFVLLLGIKLTQLLGVAIFFAVLPFMFTRILSATYTHLGYYFLFQSTLMLISQPAWVFVSRKFGKKPCYYIAAMIYAIASLSWIIAEPGEPNTFIYLRGMLAGLGAGGLLLVGQSLLPDTMQYDYQLTGLRREGILAGLYTTVEKVSFGLGPALVGLLLGTAGYIESAAATVIQPETALTVIRACASWLPTLFLLASCLLLTRYNLSEDRLKSQSQA